MRVFEVFELDNFVDNSDVANDPDFRNGIMDYDNHNNVQILKGNVTWITAIPASGNGQYIIARVDGELCGVHLYSNVISQHGETHVLKIADKLDRLHVLSLAKSLMKVHGEAVLTQDELDEMEKNK